MLIKIPEITLLQNELKNLLYWTPGQDDTPEFLAENKIHVIASLPCYSAKNVNLQRGSGVFDKSIQALVRLGELGYGKPNTGLELDLVYNPLGENHVISYMGPLALNILT